MIILTVRDLDRREREQLSESDCAIFTRRDIDVIGMYGVLQKTMRTLTRFEKIHISLDMDAMNANGAPVGTHLSGGPAANGNHLRYQQAEFPRHHGDQPDPGHQQPNRADPVSLASSLFGKRIL